MKVTFCGVRGSTPAPGQPYVRYGGHTSCVAVQRDGEPVRLLLDAGTGIQAATDLIEGPYAGSIALSHLHWDHTHGLPFFAAGLRPGSRVAVLLPAQDEPAEALLSQVMSPPSFPIVPVQLGPGWTFATLDEGAVELEGFRVVARDIPHKGGRTFGYRVSDEVSTIAYLSDHSPTTLGGGPDGYGERHEAALSLAAGADLLIHDAQHTAAEFPEVGYLGHASIEYAVALGREAAVRTVVLYHHGHLRTDDQIDEIVAAAQGSGVHVIAAFEGLSLSIPRTPAAP